jgi:hypothetical protein
MKHDPEYEKLRESRWRRKLTEAERAQLRPRLAADPERRADWEAEAALGEALRRLPDVAVPSNFTARVLQAVEREEAARRQQGGAWRLWRAGWRLLPRTAFAVLAVTLGLMAYRVSETHQRRAQIARSVAVIADVAVVPSPDALQDFDAIRALPASPPPDEQLLALFE